MFICIAAGWVKRNAAGNKRSNSKRARCERRQPELSAAIIGFAGVAAALRLVLVKREQNIGTQGYLLTFPEAGQAQTGTGTTGSDNGTTMATALIRRAANIYRWPALGALAD